MASIPTSTEIYAFLEQYGIDVSILSSTWINARITNFIVPYIESAIGFSLNSSETIVEYHDGTGQSTLILDRRHPDIELISIQYMTANISQIVDISAVEVIGKEGVIKAKRSIESDPLIMSMFPRGNKNIKITYKIGYTSTAIPNDISEAILYLASEQALGFIAARTGGGALNVQSFGRNYGSRGKWTDIRNDLARQAKSIINKYNSGVVGN